jgi:hypothetical protein
MPHAYAEDLLVEQPAIGLILLGVAVGVARVHWLACAGLAKGSEIYAKA